jgi:hypothetical protein
MGRITVWGQTWQIKSKALSSNSSPPKKKKKQIEILRMRWCIEFQTEQRRKNSQLDPLQWNLRLQRQTIFKISRIKKRVALKENQVDIRHRKKPMHKMIVANGSGLTFLYCWRKNLEFAISSTTFKVSKSLNSKRQECKFTTQGLSLMRKSGGDFQDGVEGESRKCAS